MDTDFIRNRFDFDDGASSSSQEYLEIESRPQHESMDLERSHHDDNGAQPDSASLQLLKVASPSMSQHELESASDHPNPKTLTIQQSRQPVLDNEEVEIQQQLANAGVSTRYKSSSNNSNDTNSNNHDRHPSTTEQGIQSLVDHSGLEDKGSKQLEQDIISCGSQMDTSDQVTTNNSSSSTTKDRHRKSLKRPLQSSINETHLKTHLSSLSNTQTASHDDININLNHNRRSPMSENGGCSSGSGTEGGYAASTSSNGVQHSCSSPSASPSEEESPFKRNPAKRKHTDCEFSSSEDFSSDPSSTIQLNSSSAFNPSSSSAVRETALGSSSADESGFSDESDNPPLKISSSPRRNRSSDSFTSQRSEKKIARKKTGDRNQTTLKGNFKSAIIESRKRQPNGSRTTLPPPRLKSPSDYEDGSPGILSLSSDVLAQCMAYLKPTEVHDVLTMPICKDWRASLTIPQDLWKILCLVEPLKAKIELDDQDSDDSNVTSPIQGEAEVKQLLGRYRLLYTSFVRCMKYLDKIKDDAINGRPPSVIDYGNVGSNTSLMRTNEGLKTFLSRARKVVNKKKKVRKGKRQRGHDSRRSSPIEEGSPIGVTDDSNSVEDMGKKMPAQPTQGNAAPVKFGHSKLTQRLLGPSMTGEAGNINLPWSCAIYSIVNWMVAFVDVEGLQTMCLKALPSLLEDESQRTTAQRAGLTDVVLRGMVLFPNSVELHTAAFHTIVLLARPLGGKEGMLFHCSMVNSSGIFNSGSRSGKNGIAVMLDSMKRFEHDPELQAMSCWSLVNVALAPSQKAVLVKLGGISIVSNAMMKHPFNSEVQFRALFALINLVIPSVNLSENNPSEEKSIQDHLGEVNNSTEKDLLDDSVGQIANLVVVAMKNFCSSESILNRACLVLHNLSLTEEYHITLLWTPNCYQMLEWCLANHTTDQVLQQSASGTLHRLQNTLSGDEDLRRRFLSSLQTHHQSSLEQAHREAVLMVEQEERLGARRRGLNR